MSKYTPYIGKNIEFYRKGRNMTQEELADIIGCSNKTISKWESNEASEPGPEFLCKISDLFGVTIDDLVRKDCRRLSDRRTEDKLKEMGDAIAEIIVRALSGDAKILDYMIKNNPSILERIDHVLLEREVSKRFMDMGITCEKLGDEPDDCDSGDEWYYQSRMRYYKEAIRFYDMVVEMGSEEAAWNKIRTLRKECEMAVGEKKRCCYEEGIDDDIIWEYQEEIYSDYKEQIRGMKMSILERFYERSGDEVDSLDEFWGESGTK